MKNRVVEILDSYFVKGLVMIISYIIIGSGIILFFNSLSEQQEDEGLPLTEQEVTNDYTVRLTMKD